ncbi:MAG TPA: hypothetical protein DEB40_04695 [Elusimicrobia bacterium]|nr:hypothetical protein [Elusimicrobiota bacterium]HBT61021.1 hypothetical protein [Elusimicrobiota bacterium]
MNPLLSGLLRLVLFCAGSFVTVLPRPLEMRLGQALGRTLLVLDWKRKKIARENMARCLPELSLEQRERLLEENYRHYGILALEILHFFSPVPGHYRAYTRRVTVLEGYANWKRAHDRGKGVLFISGHFANWELMVGIGGINGIPLTLVTRHLKPEWLHKRIEAQRLSVGCQSVYQPRTVPAIMKALRKGGAIGFAGDQYMPPPMGIPVPFFGIEVDSLAAIGPLALRTGAAIIPALQKREPDGRLRIVMSEELDLGPELQDSRRVASAVALQIEKIIRANPAQWLWVHRRFKNLKPGPAR